MVTLQSSTQVDVVLVRPSIAEDSNLCHAFYRLRDAVFAEKYHWDESHGEERDRYDDAAEFLLVREGGKVIAGVRAIYRARLAPGGQLPIEEFLPGNETVPTNAVELSRMINIGKNAIGLILYKLIYDHWLSPGHHTELFATLRQQFLAMLKKRVEYCLFTELQGMHKKRGSAVFIPVRITRSDTHTLADSVTRSA